MIIYKATNLINNKIYIGQTVHTLEKRRNQHERSHRYKGTCNLIFARAIKKYGKENFSWEVIDTATTLEELNTKEEYWIAKLNSLAEDGYGYNDKRGGNNHAHSERTKRKISESQRGSLNHAYGKKGVLNPRSKRVLNLTTNVIYESSNMCAIELGLSCSHICAVCRGERGSVGGFIFRYIDSEGSIIQPKQITKPRDIKRVVNVYTNEVFDNCKLAVASVGRKVASNLSNGLKRGNGVCYFANILWCYEEVKLNDPGRLNGQGNTNS